MIKPDFKVTNTDNIEYKMIKNNSEIATTVQYIDIELLKPHPKNFYDMSALDILIPSIEEDGIKAPLEVTSDFVIINGHQRYNSALKIGLKKVPVYFKDYKNEFEEEKAIITYNLQRTKSMEEKIQEVKRLKEIETNLKKLDPNYEGKVMQRVADALGISISHAKNLDKKLQECNFKKQVVKNAEILKCERLLKIKYKTNVQVNKSSIIFRLNDGVDAMDVIEMMLKD
jgi:hypothetical protein